MKKAKRQTATESAIQKEQTFLVQLEKELTTILAKINENINTLKVEELQLRSNAVRMLNPESLCVENTVAKAEQQQTFSDNPEVVNQQEIDLDVYLKHFEGEEDEE